MVAGSGTADPSTGVVRAPMVLSASCWKLNVEFGVKLPIPAPELKCMFRVAHASAQGAVVRWLFDPVPELVQVFEDVMAKISVYVTSRE